MQWTIKKELNVSQILAILGLVVGTLFGYFNLKNTVKNNEAALVKINPTELTQAVKANSCAILEFQSVVDDLSKKQGSTTQQLNEIQSGLKRQLKYTELIARKLNIDYVE